MKKRRFKPEVRKDEILAAALRLASQGHYLKITREEIAAAIKVSGPVIHYHFKTMAQLRSDLMRAAVKQEVLTVIAQGLVGNDPRTARISDELKRQAMEAVL